jgi:hypothetical protein
MTPFKYKLPMYAGLIYKTFHEISEIEDVLGMILKLKVGFCPKDVVAMQVASFSAFLKNTVQFCFEGLMAILAGLLALTFCATAASAQSTVEEAQAIYRAEQERLRCANHPDQGCLTQPESENAKAQREFKERQHRLKCAAHPDDQECR